MSGQDALIFLMGMVKEQVEAYVGIKKGAARELEHLQNELGRLLSHLEDGAGVIQKTSRFKENEKQIRKLAYEVEDTIEIYLTNKAAGKTRGLWTKLGGKISTTMEKTVKELREKKVKPFLEYLNLQEMPNAEAGGGSGTSLRKSPTERKEDNANSNAINWEKPEDVELSYHALPHDERVCFLYTGLFPPDYEIPVSTLTQLWISERFIHPEDGTSLEETAEKLLTKLIRKEFLVAKKKILDQVKTCQVNDKIREFCKKKAKDESLFTLIEPPVHDMGQSFYRLCFHSDPSSFLSEKPNLENVRSFLCLVKPVKPGEHIRIDSKHISLIPEIFKPLRILNFKSTKFDKLPENITSLILLKHVTLSIDDLKSLPEDISKLSNLQTLVVETGSASITVQANIWKMMQLRHLKTKVSAFVFLYDKKGEAAPAHKNLQTITRLSPESCSAALSEKAPYLKSLGIRGEIRKDLDLEKLRLQDFKHLEKLKLENYVHYGLESDNAVTTVPSADRFPLMLKRLTLSRTYLLWNTHMSILAKINTLEVLKVKDMAFKGPAWLARREDEFLNLHYLLIENTDLAKWKAYPDQFPLLECLVIKDCDQLKTVPDCLQAKLVKKPDTE